MKKDSPFTIMADKLNKHTGYPSLLLENNHYRIRFFYDGDYTLDKENGTLSHEKITMNSQEKSTQILPLTLLYGQIAITNAFSSSITTYEAGAAAEALEFAAKDAAQLQKIYDTYFTNKGDST